MTSFEELDARIPIPKVLMQADWCNFLLWAAAPLPGQQGPRCSYPFIVMIDRTMRWHRKRFDPQGLEGGPELFDAAARQARKEVRRRLGNVPPLRRSTRDWWLEEREWARLDTRPSGPQSDLSEECCRECLRRVGSTSSIAGLFRRLA